MNPASLIHAVLDGDITPEQHAKLEALLRDDWRVRRLYLELTDQDARLFRQPVVNSGRLRPSPVIGRTARWRTAALVAAGVAMVLPVFIVWPRSAVEKEASSDGVAMVSDTVDAEFADTAVRSGDTIAPGKLTLKKGLAQIEFFSGATVLIEGATHIEVISAWEARCLAGRVRVQVPPAAKGFLMHAPEVMLEDLGTEFALNVTGRDSAVHVFAGEVIAHTKEQAPESLKAGMSLTSAKADVSPRDFLPISDLKGLIRQREQRRFEHWQTWSEGVREDPRLIAYYTFQHTPGDRWDRLVSNLADPLQKQRAGGAVGARWTQGRWPGKEALEFKRPGDRLRLNLDGTYTALTLSAWVKVDSVDKKYNSLLLTDGYDNGEPHWQIYEDGSLMFSIIYRPEGVTRGGDWNQTYYSKPVFSADSLGRWHHIAVSYSHHSGEVIQYFDGVEVGREVSTRHRPGLPIAFGPCEIGNWGLPTERHPAPIRNLNGVIDEFAIYGSVLSGAEVQAIFANGRPE